MNTATTMANGHIIPCYHNHRYHYQVRQSIYIVTMHKIVKLKQISSNEIAYRFSDADTGAKSESEWKEKRKRERQCAKMCMEWARVSHVCVCLYERECFFVIFLRCTHLHWMWWIEMCTRRTSSTKDYFVTYREYLMKDSLWSWVFVFEYMIGVWDGTKDLCIFCSMYVSVPLASSHPISTYVLYYALWRESIHWRVKFVPDNYNN